MDIWFEYQKNLKSWTTDGTQSGLALKEYQETEGKMELKQVVAEMSAIKRNNATKSRNTKTKNTVMQQK